MPPQAPSLFVNPRSPPSDAAGTVSLESAWDSVFNGSEMSCSQCETVSLGDLDESELSEIETTCKRSNEREEKEDEGEVARREEEGNRRRRRKRRRRRRMRRRRS
eukprot:3075153-Pyramimonas_sp.AAC.1